MEKKAIAAKLIHQKVWAGFYGENEVAEIVAESVFHQGDVDEKWLHAEIRREFDGKRREEAAWPVTTDCDRLDQVFATLDDQGILALQNAGYTQSDGMSDVSEVWYGLGAEDSGVIGYCFYHEQDVEGVLESGNLYIAFGDILGVDEAAGTNDRGVEIGQQIVRELGDSGFTVDWDETIKTRICVKGMKWQRRAD